MKIYLDNAASTPLDSAVFEAMVPYLRDHYGNPSSIHWHGRQLKVAIENARKKVAELLECAPGNIIFTSGGTEADNFCIRTFTECEPQNTSIISSPLEHHAVTHTIESLQKRYQLPVHFLSHETDGSFDLAQLEILLQQIRASDPDRRILVSLMHGNNEIGNLNNITAIGELCKLYQAYYHSDTVQTIGHYSISAKMPLDYFVASAHKFYGPKGIGFLYCQDPTSLQPLICGGGQERNLRAGTENVAAIVGMATALELSLKHAESRNTYIKDLKEYFKHQLCSTFSSIRFNGKSATEDALCSVLNVGFNAGEDAMLLFNLDINGVSVSGGSACSSGANHGSHVLRAIKTPENLLANSIRFSFGKQNNKQEIDFVIQTLKKTLLVEKN